MITQKSLATLQTQLPGLSSQLRQSFREQLGDGTYLTEPSLRPQRHPMAQRSSLQIRQKSMEHQPCNQWTACRTTVDPKKNQGHTDQRAA
jgi:hypothetical protein